MDVGFKFNISFNMTDRSNLNAEIQTGANLKHTETVDKSKPIIEPGVQIKENPHGALMDEVKGDHQLKHTETNDRSVPHIEEDVKLKTNVHGQLFDEIKSKGEKH